ncbi:N-acyl-D-amino-acid deacylase family protein [Heliobacterium mobile]|nr:amidohydrolase family protein [Heliobacterium mobile]
MRRRDFLQMAATFVGAAMGGSYFAKEYLVPLMENDLPVPALPTGLVPQPVMFPAKTQDVSWNLLIHNGKIVDGLGVPAYEGAIAIKGDRIEAVVKAEAETRLEKGLYINGNQRYRLPEQCQIIDAAGGCITPGFVDIHTHNEDYLKANPIAGVRLFQGITSQIGGNCGDSVDNIKDFRNQLGSLGVNYGQLVGYLNLRRQVLGGDVDRKASPKEIDQMRNLLLRGLGEGATGMSVALEYTPQYSMTKEELKQYAQALKSKKALLAVHLRSESQYLLEAVDEILEVARATGVSVQISHVKALLSENWSKFPKILDKIRQAAESGLDVWGDMYVYDYPSWDFGSTQVFISEDNIALGLAHPRIFIASDAGLYENGGAGHPRAYGNYPRVISRYVRQNGVLTLEKAIAKMTSMPATRLGLRDRGRLTAGAKADVIVFDYERFRDLARKEHPDLLPEGMKHVFVNGVQVIDGGKLTGKRPGEWLKGEGIEHALL